jgi:hypothetical protein
MVEKKLNPICSAMEYLSFDVRLIDFLGTMIMHAETTLTI